MAKTSKSTPFFLALVTFWAFSFQARSLPMFFGGGEQDLPSSSRKLPAETIEQEGRRETESAHGDTRLNGSSSSQAARGATCYAVDSSMQDDEVEHKADESEAPSFVSRVSPSQFADAAVNCGTDPLAQEAYFSEKFEKILSLENFRAAAINPNFANAEQLIIDPERGFIRPHNKGSDSKTKGKNETIIAALKAALQIEFPGSSPALIERIVEEELPQRKMWSMMLETLRGKPALSTETLQRILEKADTLMEEQEFAEEHSFTLQHFRNALAHPDNQGAERLIISGQGASAMIVAQAGNNHAEDKMIRGTLKRALEREKLHKNFVHALTSEFLPYSSAFAKVLKIRVPLSFEKLRIIIQQADDAIAEIKLLQATRSIALPLPSKAARQAAKRTLIRNMLENVFERLGIQNETLAAQVAQKAIPKSNEEITSERAEAARQEASEKSEMEKILRHIICNERNLDELKEHYREAEEAAIAAEAAHDQDEEVGQNAKNAKELLAEARKFFEKVKTALAEKRELAEFDQSTLSKLSQGADLTGAVLGIFNVPFLNVKGIADAVSTFATFTEHRMTIVEAQKAYKNLQVAIQKAEAAIEGHEQVEETASKLQAHAIETEQLKKQEKHDETMRLLSVIRPPTDATDDDLRQWAKELTCESDVSNQEQADITTYLFYKHAKKNLTEIHELISGLWGKRVALLQEELQHLTEQPPFDPEYEMAHKKELEAKAAAKSATDRLEKIEQQQKAWLSKKDQLRIEKQTLEDQVRTDAEHRAERQKELEAKREEFSKHQTEQESINRNYLAAVTDAKHLTLEAAKAHTDGFKKHKIFIAAKQLYTRNMARLQASVELHQKVFYGILSGQAHQKAVEAGSSRSENFYFLIQAAWEDVAQAYSKASELHNKTELAVRAYLKCAQVHEKRILPLTRDDIKAAQFHLKCAKILSEAADAYLLIDAEQTKGNQKTAQAYHKLGQAYEMEASALEKGEKDAAEFYEKTAKIWKCAAEAYTRSIVIQEKNEMAAQAYHNLGQTYEMQVLTLEKGEKDAAEFHEDRAAIWQCAAERYTNAFEMQGKSEMAAQAFYKAALGYEAKIKAMIKLEEAFARSDQEAVRRYKTISDLYASRVTFIFSQGVSGSYENAAVFYMQNSRKPAELFNKAALSYEAAIAALAQNNEEACNLNTEAGVVLHMAGLSSGMFLREEAPPDQISADAVKSMMADWDRAVESHESQAAALIRGEKEIAELYKKIATAFGSPILDLFQNEKGLINAQSDFFQMRAQGKEKAAAAYSKGIQACREWIIALEQQISALTLHDKSAVKLYEELAEAHEKVFKSWVKSAEASKEEAIALSNSDKKTEKFQEQLAEIWAAAARAHENRTKHQAKGNSRASTKLSKIAESREAQATAFANGDTKTAELQKQIADTWIKIGIAHKNASKETAKGNREAAEPYLKEAQEYEAQAATLSEQIKATAQDGIPTDKASSTDLPKKNTGPAPQQEKPPRDSLGPGNQISMCTIS